jgi:hypothetical protein
LPGGIKAKTRLQPGFFATLTGTDLPAVAARGSPADPLRFQHDHRITTLGQMQCRGQARVAGANHADIGSQRIAQYRIFNEAARSCDIP